MKYLKTNEELKLNLNKLIKKKPKKEKTIQDHIVDIEDTLYGLKDISDGKYTSWQDAEAITQTFGFYIENYKIGDKAIKENINEEIDEIKDRISDIDPTINIYTTISREKKRNPSTDVYTLEEVPPLENRPAPSYILVVMIIFSYVKIDEDFNTRNLYSVYYHQASKVLGYGFMDSYILQVF